MRQLLLLFFICFCSVAIHAEHSTSDTVVISGIIRTSTGEPIGAVLVEQLQSHNYALTDKNGKFELSLKASVPYFIQIQYIGHKPYIMDLRKSTDRYFEITLVANDSISAPENHIENFPIHKKLNIYALAFHIGYTHINTSFNEFAEFTTLQRLLLNNLDNFICYGFSFYYKNITVGFSWGATPTQHNYDIHDRKNTSLAQMFHFKAGYIFPVYKSKLFITPHLGISNITYSQTIVPDKKMPFSDYWEGPYSHANLNQSLGMIGGDFEYNFLDFGDRDKHNLLLCASVGYTFKLQKYTRVSAYNIRLSTDNAISQGNVYFQASIKYMFHSKFHKDINPKQIISQPF